MPKKLKAIKFTEMQKALICQSLAETHYTGRNSKLVASVLEELDFEFPLDEQAPLPQKDK